MCVGGNSAFGWTKFTFQRHIRSYREPIPLIKNCNIQVERWGSKSSFRPNPLGCFFFFGDFVFFTLNLVLSGERTYMVIFASIRFCFVQTIKAYYNIQVYAANHYNAIVTVFRAHCTTFCNNHNYVR